MFFNLYVLRKASKSTRGICLRAFNAIFLAGKPSKLFLLATFICLMNLMRSIHSLGL